MDKEWIKIEDQLPEENKKLFYYFEWTGVNRGYYTQGAYKTNIFYGEKGFLSDDVTHWMYDDGEELPNPPN